MTDSPQTQPPGWYYAQGDPPGTQRYWDGSNWQGGPQPVPGAGMGGLGVDDPVLADPIKRIVGAIIDGLIWAAVGLIVSVPFGISVVRIGGGSAIADIFASLVGAAFVVAYEVFMISTRGATLGKMAMGTKVLAADGSPADVEVALRRMALYIAVTVLGLIPIIGLFAGVAWLGIALAGLIMLFADSRQQTPWDKVGRTIVVEA